MLVGGGNPGVGGQDKPVEVRSVSALGAHGAHDGGPTVEGGQEGPSSYNSKMLLSSAATEML